MLTLDDLRNFVTECSEVPGNAICYLECYRSRDELGLPFIAYTRLEDVAVSRSKEHTDARFVCQTLNETAPVSIFFKKDVI